MKTKVENKVAMEVFNEIKTLLKTNFPNNYKENEQYEGCTDIVIEPNSKEQFPIWMEYDNGNSEIIVGYGMSHLHFGKQYGEELTLSKGFNVFLNFLTSKVRRIDFYKGKFNSKSICEIEQKNGTYENFATSVHWLFPFWKKTTKITTEINSYTENKEIIKEIKRIRKLIKNVR